MAETIYAEVAAMAERHGVERLLFITLTFPVKVTNHVQAQARWHSLCTNVMKKRYPQGGAVFERHASLGIHVHCVAVARADVRTGFDFEAFRKAKGKLNSRAEFWQFTRQYGASASPALRAEWNYWKRVAPRYGFGRVEVAPVHSTPAAVARYLASYLTKAGNAKLPEDGRSKLVRFWGFGRGKVVRTRLASGWAWNSPMARIKCSYCWHLMIGPKGGRILETP